MEKHKIRDTDVPSTADIPTGVVNASGGTATAVISAVGATDTSAAHNKPSSLSAWESFAPSPSRRKYTGSVCGNYMISVR